MSRRQGAYSFLTNRDGGDLFVLLSSQISHQAAGIITWHRTHQHWSAGLHLQTQVMESQRQIHNGKTPLERRWLKEILVNTSLSTMLARSRGCSMMFMKVSPSTFETKMCDMASRRSGRKAWISNSWCTAWPMGAEQGRAEESLIQIIYTYLHLNQYLFGLNCHASF